MRHTELSRSTGEPRDLPISRSLGLSNWVPHLWPKKLPEVGAVFYEHPLVLPQLMHR